MSSPRGRANRLRAGLLAPVVVGVLPVLLVTATSLAHIGRPGISRGDYAFIELATRSAVHGDALLGPYSRFGWNHPGPMAFYWFAPWFRLFGERPESLGFAAAVLNLILLGASIAVAGRSSGPRAAWASAMGAVLLVVVWGSSWVDRIWNPFVVLTPIIAVAFSAAGVLSGRRCLMIVLVVVGSFAVQTHLGTLPIVAAIGLVTVAQLLWGARRAPRDAWALWRAPLGWAVAAGIVLWTLPVVEQASGHPGNVGQVVQFIRSGRPDHGLGEVLDKVAVQLTLGKVGLISNVVSARRPLPAATPGRLIALLALVASVAVCALANGRAGRRFEQHLCTVSLAAAAAATFAAWRVVGALEGYLTLPASAAGALLWGAVVLTAAGAADDRLPQWVRSSGARAAVAAVVILSLWCARGVWLTDPGSHLQVPVVADPSAVTLSRHLADVVAPFGSVRLDPAPGAMSTAAMVANQIELGGGEVHVDPSLDHFFGRARWTDGCERLVVRVGTAGAPPDPRFGRILDTFADQAIQIRTVPVERRCRGG